MTQCPKCNSEFDLDRLDPRQVGAVAMCVLCGQLMVVDDGPVLRSLTDKEMKQALDSGLLHSMQLYLRVIRQLEKIERQLIERHLMN